MAEDGSEQGKTPERRKHPRMRELFGEACELLEPVMGDVKRGVVSEYALLHIVHDHFSDLTDVEAQVMVTGVVSFFRQRQPD